jgi:hypothetical protein
MNPKSRGKSVSRKHATSSSTGAVSKAIRKSPSEGALLDAASVVAMAEAGPPREPTAAVFWDVVQHLLEALLQECRGGARWEARREEAFAYLEARLRTATGHPTLYEQNRALMEGLSALMPRPGRMDLRKKRERRSPPGGRLEAEYQTLRAELKPLLTSDRLAHQKQIRNALRSRYREFAESRKALEEAAESAPSTAAYIVLGRRYHLSPDEVRKELVRARASRRQVSVALSNLRAEQPPR